jgi:hypothetical protein
MPCKARIVLEGQPHHITQRGNNRQDVFFVDDRNRQGLLEEKLDRDYIARLRLSTSRGRSLATDSFLSKMEKIAGRRLRPLPVGRPKERKRKTRV